MGRSESDMREEGGRGRLIRGIKEEGMETRTEIESMKEGIIIRKVRRRKKKRRVIGDSRRKKWDIPWREERRERER